MKIIRSFTAVFLSAIFSCILTMPASVHAGEATEQIRTTVDEILRILDDKELKKPGKEELRRTKIRQTVDVKFDFEEMAKRALALHWRKRTAEEQKEFVALFSDLLETSYINKVERYENEKVLYIDEKVEGRYAAVKTRIVTKKEIEIPVDYRIFKKDSKWEVYDVIIEGVSLVNNYRTQFNQIIRSSSYEDLVDRLKKKVVKAD